MVLVAAGQAVGAQAVDPKDRAVEPVEASGEPGEGLAVLENLGEQGVEIDIECVEAGASPTRAASAWRARLASMRATGEAPRDRSARWEAMNGSTASACRRGRRSPERRDP